jgi:CxxC-x17-CxxC domain-containing protein
MELRDRVLKCVDCKTDFIFTIGEQEFFRERQFKNEPKRCKTCKARAKGRLVMASPPVLHRTKIETHTRCSQCGKSTTVPFVPTQGRPVLCRDCFAAARTSASA